MDLLENLSLKGKFIASLKPWSIRKSLTIWGLFFFIVLFWFEMLNSLGLILSYPIILAISSDKSFWFSISCLYAGTLILLSITLNPSLFKCDK